MTYVREQLRQRLAHQFGQAYRRWLHPTSGRRLVLQPEIVIFMGLELV